MELFLIIHNASCAIYCSFKLKSVFSNVKILCLQERDAERRRQLRERARQLIAEARSGVKMSDMSLLDSSSAEKSKSGKASLAGGQQTTECTHTHTHSVNKHAMNECLDIHCTCLYELAITQKGQTGMLLTYADRCHPHMSATHTFPLCSLKGFCLIPRGNRNAILPQPRV